MEHKPKVIEASVWKEILIDTGKMEKLGSVKFITLHHTNSNPLHPYSDKVRLNKILDFHTKARGWNDIGYHFLISPGGKIYEGRNIAFQGAHVEGYNQGNIGIAVIGDYNVEKVSQGLNDALRYLVEKLMKRFGLSIEDLKGHRDFKEIHPGTCPGDFIYQWLREYNNE
ncbi:MAG TPA: N-acetylmuramoyl-L-alanine amidase [Firmicutes bacterium]|nr:N-acetylmuramoyl-L-alanine amidase [Bacillota bacterium]